MKKKALSLLMLVGLLSFTSCRSQEVIVDTSKKEFLVGISQLVRHPALDKATEGFKDSITKVLNENGRTVKFIETNSQGESSLCTIAAQGLISNGVDLIMANATAAFQGAVNSTRTIPIVGTSITSYSTAIGRDIKDNIIATNATGTTDLAPLDKQAQMIKDLLPDARKIGLLYCSSEANSIYQIDEVEKHLKTVYEGIDYKATRYSFVDSNDVEAVARKAALDSDVIYVPTDNTISSNSLLIASATKNNGKRTPIICGEEGPAVNTGIATLTISYYDLGVTTGEMAADILLGNKKVEQMAIQPAGKSTKKYNERLCKDCGIEIDERFKDFEKM